MPKRKKRPSLPLKQWRDAKDLTQEGLARELNVSVRSVARWEAGESQPLPCLEDQIRKVLDVFPGHCPDLDKQD